MSIMSVMSVSKRNIGRATTEENSAGWPLCFSTYEIWGTDTSVDVLTYIVHRPYQMTVRYTERTCILPEVDISRIRGSRLARLYQPSIFVRKWKCKPGFRNSKPQTATCFITRRKWRSCSAWWLWRQNSTALMQEWSRWPPVRLFSDSQVPLDWFFK